MYIKQYEIQSQYTHTKRRALYVKLSAAATVFLIYAKLELLIKLKGIYNSISIIYSAMMMVYFIFGCHHEYMNVCVYDETTYGI